MASYAITIKGMGQHHNGDIAKDADALAKQFAQQLQAAGHTVTAAEFQQQIDGRPPEPLLDGVSVDGWFPRRTAAGAAERPAVAEAATDVDEPTG